MHLLFHSFCGWSTIVSKLSQNTFLSCKGAALGGLSDLRDPEGDILQPLFVADSRDTPGERGGAQEQSQLQPAWSSGEDNLQGAFCFGDGDL